MKKLLSFMIVAVLVMSSSVVNAYDPIPLTDINSSTDYRRAINWMFAEGIIEGYSTSDYGQEFRPDKCVNRVEFLKMLFETRKIDVDGYHTVGFSDTDTFQWYQKYLNAGKLRGLVVGYPDGTFRPNNCVKRVEAIKMAMKEYYPSGLTFYYQNRVTVEDANPNEWYYDYLLKVLDRSLVGTLHLDRDPKSFFGVGDDMSRKEVAEMLYRMETVADNNLEYYTDDFVPDSDWDDQNFETENIYTLCSNDSKYAISPSLLSGSVWPSIKAFCIESNTEFYFGFKAKARGTDDVMLNYANVTINMNSDFGFFDDNPFSIDFVPISVKNEYEANLRLDNVLGTLIIYDEDFAYYLNDDELSDDYSQLRNQIISGFYTL